MARTQEDLGVISLLCPSRGRPEQLMAMWHSAYETAANPDDEIELVVRIDEDDRSYDKLRQQGARARSGVVAGMPRQIIRWVEGPRITMSALWNDAWHVAVGDVYMHCADDIRFREPGWDLRVAMHFDKLPDRIGFVYGRDGAHDQNLGTHGFLSREWTQVVGHFLPPYFSCDYADTWLNEVADVIGRRIYDPHIYTEHMHPALGKGEYDLTHQERHERDAADNNTQRYTSLAGKRVEWIMKLQAAMQ
jgi:hypothetical protein